MKKILLTALSIIAFSSIQAQEKGKFETYDFDSFKLHVYYTNDALGENKTPQAFVEALKKAYPQLPGAEGLEAAAEALYK